MGNSNAGTDLKVGWGAPIRREAHKNLVMPIHFVCTKSSLQLVVLVSAFVMVSTVWSVSCLLLYYSRCPPRAQPFVFCKSGGTCPPCPMESAPLLGNLEIIRSNLNRLAIFFTI